MGRNPTIYICICPHLPGDADGLGVLKCRSQSVPVQRSDVINAQPDAQEDQRGVELAGRTAAGNVEEAIFVDVGGIVADIDA